MINDIKNLIQVSNKKKMIELHRIIDDLDTIKREKLYDFISVLKKDLDNKMFIISDLSLDGANDHITISLGLNLE
jgi:hypothetical protein